MDKNLPTFVSVSGGRTSAYMAYLLKDQGYTFLFQNTGRERPETYNFLRDIQKHWGIKIIWLEYTAPNKSKATSNIVDYNTANRNGLPFSQVIDKRAAIPNKYKRFCTQELKVLTARRYIRSLGIKKWNNLVGFRADEGKRVNKLSKRKAGKTIQEFVYAPLFDKGKTIQDVRYFWMDQEFDLHLPMMPNGKTVGGNCMGCFWHSEYQNAQLCKNKPDEVDWLIEQEEKIGFSFNDGFTFKELKSQAELSFDFNEEEYYCQATNGSCGG